jgi:hypothetical protein
VQNHSEVDCCYQLVPGGDGAKAWKPLMLTTGKLDKST